jgi:hypothetical protein
MLCEEAVSEWKTIYEEQTGETIGMKEATERANRMFRFLKTITKPSSSRKFENTKGGVITNGKKAKSNSARRN